MHHRPAAVARALGVDPWDLVLPAPAAAEVRFGLERLPSGRRRSLLESEFHQIQAVTAWADWTERGAAAFGTVKAELERAGQRIDDLDVAIASIALALQLPVATCNVRHFDRIAGLGVVDWSETGRD